ncbi:MAG: N-acetylmuramoyl-L-alanine amidase [Candidatus Omnitrophica bacterium]|nr:N-acetylmuramoyl-L-alanine amidase [Candidatus Omnitrophota bacterium]
MRSMSSFNIIRVMGIALVVWGCSSTPVQYTYTPMGPISVLGTQGVGAPHDVFHIVGPSETLWRISKTYGVDMDILMQVNHVSDPTQIKAGQELLIPSTYGARPLVPLFPSKRWTHIVIHHTATDYGDAFSIDQLHHKRGWWNGLGYHFLINNGTMGKEDGQIQAGPRWMKQKPGAHAKDAGMNERGIGIGIVGNFSQDMISKAEMDSLVFLVKTLQEYYQIPDQNVIGHRDVPGAKTECPGNYFPWFEFKKKIASS